LKTASDIEVDIIADRFLLLSTAIILQILEIRFSSERRTWAGIIRKSKDWMMEVIHEAKPRIHGKDLVTWAEGFVQDNILI